MNGTQRDQVFISYAHEDLDAVKTVVQGLRGRKLTVWFDKDNLAPGRWKTQIIKAITRSRFFVICISTAALRKTGDKPGFQDNELQTAYEIAQAQADQQFAIVPVRLEDCERGDFRITSFQQYDLFPDIEGGLDKLAVHLGGVSLSNDTSRDERTEDQKIVDSLFGKSKAAYYANEFEKALAITTSILAIDPSYVEGWVHKGAVLLNLGRNEDALLALDKALELNPDYSNAWNNKGIALEDLGRFEEALLAYDKALEIDSNNSPAWANKGVALKDLGKAEEALLALDRALQHNPMFRSAWHSKGNALLDLRRPEEALKAYGEAISLDADYSLAWAGKGAALGRLGRPEEALRAFEKALELNPEDPHAWNGKGVALHDLGRDQEALEAFEKALEIDPQYADAQINKKATNDALGSR